MQEERGERRQRRWENQRERDRERAEIKKERYERERERIYTVSGAETTCNWPGILYAIEAHDRTKSHSQLDLENK